jgi:hypothetical protein
MNFMYSTAHFDGMKVSGIQICPFWNMSAKFLITYIMGGLHNPTHISENCVVQHQKVLYDKNGIDPI